MSVTEARRVRSMADIRPGRLPFAQQAALMRLQLWLTGETHQRMLDFGSQAQAILLEYARSDGTLDTAAAYMAQMQIAKAWSDTFAGWSLMVERARREAASIPFGSLAVMHRNYVKPTARRVTEASTNPGSVFEPQLGQVVGAAGQRIYGDGLTLSGRIWRMDRETREGINRVLMQGIQDQSSAWDIAKNLEQFLGAGQDCPRWTSTRLYTLTKKDIASGDRRGLKTGEECKGQGVSYNALRLARTEMQFVHHLASDQVLAAQPWVMKEQIVLSPAHPVPDICDDVIAQGEGGQGIYPVGSVQLPLHPNCLCFKISVMQSDEDFTARMRNWMAGGSDTAMDQYAHMIGASTTRQVLEIDFLEDFAAQALGVWLWGGPEALKDRMGL